MAVLNRSTLTESPLADLHELAGELGIEGFRKLRKDDLIGEVLKSQGIEDPGPAPKPAPVADAADARDDEPPSRSRRSRSGRAPRDEDTDAEADPRRVRSRREHGEDVEGRGESRRGSSRGERDSARGGRGRERGRRTPDVDSDSPAQQKVAEGVVEVVANGSGFLRVAPPEASDADIYVSAAQVRRCELVTGDKVSGPVRAPRRSERYSSLVRIDTINGKPTEEVAEGTRFDDFAASYPTERIALNTTDKALKAIDVLVPIGKGTRATIVGAPHAGKSALIRAYAAALTHAEDLETSVVVVGVRPEEIADWPTGPEAPAARLSFTASAEAQGQAVTSALDTARRIAARGGDAVVVIDSLDALPAGVARRALATARNLTDSGSVTVIVTSAEPVGIETTLITLDPAAARAGLPALDLGRSGTMHDGLLLTKAAVAKNLKERAAALGVAAPTVDAGPDAVATPAAAKPAAKKRAAKKPAAKRAPVKRPDARTKPELA